MSEFCRYCGCEGLHGTVDECLTALHAAIALTRADIQTRRDRIETGPDRPWRFKKDRAA